MYYDNLETEIASSAVTVISYSLYSVSKCKENIKCKIMVDAYNDGDDYSKYWSDYDTFGYDKRALGSMRKRVSKSRNDIFI